MIEIPSLRPETRYGIPPADHMLFNREYIVGYSYLFRQARWAMEVIDPENKAVNVERKDPFRADLRIPEQFRATLEDFSGSGTTEGIWFQVRIEGQLAFKIARLFYSPT